MFEAFRLVSKEVVNEQSQIQTNVIHFKRKKATLGSTKVTVITRLHYDDPRNLTPNKITCYVKFNDPELPTIEFGNKNTSSFYLPNFIKKSFSINDNQVLILKKNYCLY